MAGKSPKPPDDVTLAVLVLGGDKGGIDALAGLEVDAIDPSFAHDLPQKILDHAPVGEEKSVTEVVLSHDFSRLRLYHGAGRGRPRSFEKEMTGLAAFPWEPRHLAG